MRTSQSVRRRRPIYKSVGNDRLAPQFRRALLEHLEQRRLLAANPFSGFATSLQQEVASIQTTVDKTLQAASNLKSLPFIGQQLGAINQVQNFFDNAGNKIQSVLSNVGNVSATSGELQHELYTALGPSPGAGIVAALSSIDVTNFKTNSNGVPTSFDVEIWIHVAPASVSQSINFNLGLPALPFKVTATGGLTASVGVDVDLAADYNQGSTTIDSSKNLQDFSSSLPAAQLAFSVTAGLSSDASLTADLGLLQGTLTPTQGQQNSLSATVTVANLGSPSVNFGGDAYINLTANLSFGNGGGGAAFPSISTDISMSWPDLTSPGSLTFNYGNVQLNLGEFISNLVEPVLADIQQYTKPFQSTIDVLNAPIPGIDYFLPGFSLMTLAGGIAHYTGWGDIEGLVADAIQLASLINGFDVTSLDNVTMPMGDFDLPGSAITGPNAPTDALDPTVLSNLADNLTSLDVGDLTGSSQAAIGQFAGQVDSKLATAINNAGLPSGVAAAATTCLDALAEAVTGGGPSATLDFPLFDNPASIVGLFFGQDPDLVTFNANFSFGIPPSAFPPSVSFAGLGVGFTSSLSASGSLTLGYDTYGLRELLGNIENGTANPGNIATDIADGFYIQGPQGGNPGSNVTITGQIGAGIGGTIGIDGLASASLYVYGGLMGTVSVSLNDQFPDTAMDGRIRYSEIASEIGSPNSSVFDVSGSVSAGLSIVATGTALGITESKTLWSIGTSTLFNTNNITNNTISDTSPPTVTSISTASAGPAAGAPAGPAGGGTVVTIYGTNLDGATAVDFGGVASPTIESDSATCIIATSPAESIGPQYVYVTTPYGMSAASSNADFTFVEPPIISSLLYFGVSTTSGPQTGGETIDISGVFLDNATEVEFGNNQAAGLTNTDTDLYVTLPPGTGTVNVTVTTAGGTATSPEKFTYIPAPTVTSVTPDAGPLAGGQPVTIDGEEFGDATTGVGDVTGVQFGNSLVPALSQVYVPGYTFAGTSHPAYWYVTADVPNVNGTGAVLTEGTALENVTVTTLTGGPSADTFSAVYTYGTPPVVDSVAPGGGPPDGTNMVTITFHDIGGASGVFFGQNAGTIESLTEPPNSYEWTMVAKAPAGTGTVDVEVASAIGSSSPVAADKYVYTASPLITSVSPYVGPLGGGTAVTITGANLGTLANPPEVEFGNTILSPSDVAVNPNGTIAVTSPPGAAGEVAVSVITAGGTANGGFGYFIYTAAPIVSSVSTNSGPYEGGTSVTIKGTNLDGVTAVYFGAVAATNFGFYTNGGITNGFIVANSPAGVLGATVDVTVTTPGGTSATSPNDKFTYALVAPVIDLLAPATGPVTGGTSVLIVGANFFGTTEVEFDTLQGDRQASSFTVNSFTEITAVSPAHVAGGVAVRVFTPGAESITSYPDQFTYTTPVAVTGISPSSGLLAGGTAVTIMGTDLSGATAVDFGNTAAAGFAVNPDGTITATSPAESAGTVDVTVITSGGPTPTSSADKFTYQVPGPVVSEVSPDTGPPGGGTSVTITGSNLSGATEVMFGNTDARSFSYDAADDSITAVSPGGTPGSSVDVTVTTAGGPSADNSGDAFSYGALPTIYAIEYDSVPFGPSTSVFIFGTNLEGATSVTFGPVANQYTTVQLSGSNTDSGALFVNVPSENPGTVNVTVTTPNGTSLINPGDEFTYLADPVVVSPASYGPLSGGTSVALSGYGLNDATAVSFGGTPAQSFTVNSNGTITAVSPQGTPGTVYITVTTPDGTSQTGYYPYDATFTYLAPPTVTGVSPASGAEAGGDTVQIFGTALADATEVDFGGVAGTVDVSTYNYLYATTPAGTLGTVDVTVTTPGGTSAISQPADEFTYIPPPAVSGLDVTSGAIEGGTPVTINGTDLSGATEVDFGPNNPATTISNTAGQIVVTSPYSPLGYGDVAAGTVDVTVTTLGGTSAINEPADEFTYATIPYVASVYTYGSQGNQPPQGPVAGGTYVYIAGDDLDNATAVDFGQTPATIDYDSPTLLAVYAPANAEGTVDITVTTPNGTTQISPADQYTYFGFPTVDMVSPVAGGINGGQQVAITGSGLAGATQVAFDYANGRQSFATIISDTDEQLVVDSPAGLALGTVDIVVMSPGGTSTTSTADQFNYMPSPNVDGLSQSGGSTLGGDLLTVYGDALTGAQSVLFGTTPATIISNSDSEIQVVTPAVSAAGLVDVTVVTQYGPSLTSPNDEFTYTLPPNVTGISTPSGPVAGETQVEIYGDNLAGATAVDFGGIAASSFFYDVYDGSIEATSPAGAVGTVDITVVTPGGTSPASSADQFTYLPAPNISAISPSAGPITGGTQITITGAVSVHDLFVDFRTLIA